MDSTMYRSSFVVIVMLRISCRKSAVSLEEENVSIAGSCCSWNIEETYLWVFRTERYPQPSPRTEVYMSIELAPVVDDALRPCTKASSATNLLKSAMSCASLIHSLMLSDLAVCTYRPMVCWKEVKKQRSYAPLKMHGFSKLVAHS